MAEVISFKDAQMKHNPNIYKVVSIDDDDNVTVQNSLGQRLIFRDTDWVYICMDNNRLQEGQENAYWDWDVAPDGEISHEDRKRLNEWDMQRIVEYIEPDAVDMKLRGLFEADLDSFYDFYLVA